MVKKNNIDPIKLLQYYKLINHNLIYNNKAINRYKKENFEISEDKAKSLESLKRSIINLKNCLRLQDTFYLSLYLFFFPHHMQKIWKNLIREVVFLIIFLEFCFSTKIIITRHKLI